MPWISTEVLICQFSFYDRDPEQLIGELAEAGGCKRALRLKIAKDQCLEFLQFLFASFIFITVIQDSW